MKLKMTKIKTIEDLAVMIQDEFEAIHNELKNVYRVIEQIKERLDRIEFNQISHERRLSALEDKVRIISTKLGPI